MSIVQSKITNAQEQITQLTKDIKAAIRKKESSTILKTVMERVPAYADLKEPNRIKSRRLLKGHFGKLYAMHWSGDSERVLSASQDGKLILWHVASGQKISVIPLRSTWVITCGFEQTEGQVVACGGLDNTCSLYKLDAQTTGLPGRSDMELSAHDGYLSCCRFIDTKGILTASGDATCMQWDLETGECIKTYKGHTSDTMSLSICPTNDHLFVSGSCDNATKMWDMRSGKCVHTFLGSESDVNTVCFFPDGNALATGSDDSSCRIFDLRSFSEVNKFMSEKITGAVSSIDFSQSGRFLFAGYDDYHCRMWNSMENSEENRSVPISTLTGHEDNISCLGINRGTAPGAGQALVTGSWDNTLRVWA